MLLLHMMDLPLRPILCRRMGIRSVLMQVLKNGAASTLDIVNQVKELLPTIQAAAPKGMDINLDFRSVHLCQKSHRRSCHRRSISSLFDRGDGFDLFRKLAQHFYCIDIDSLVHYDFNYLLKP